MRNENVTDPIEGEFEFNTDSLKDNDSVVTSEFTEDPITSSDETIINRIQPAAWEALMTIIDFLTKDSDEPVIITDSIITHQYKESAIIQADLNNIFGSEKLNLHISSPKKWIRLLKLFKSQCVFIINKGDNRFIVTDGTTKLFMPKQIQSSIIGATFPSLEKTKLIETITLTKDIREKVNELARGQSYIELLTHEDKIKVINIPDTALYILPGYTKDQNAQNLSRDNADQILRLKAFLPYPAEMYTLALNIDEYNENFIVTSCSSKLINIKIYEKLDDASTINTLF